MPRTNNSDDEAQRTSADAGPLAADDSQTAALPADDIPTAALPADDIPTATLSADDTPTATLPADDTPTTTWPPHDTPTARPATSGHPSGAPAPADPPTPVVMVAPAAPERRGARWSTIVWGLIVAAVGVLLILGSLGWRFNTTFVLIGLLLGAGVLLIVGAIATAARRNRT